MAVRLRAFTLALTLAAGAMWPSSEAAAPATLRSGQLAWRIAETEHFEIHYLPELSAEVDRIGRAAEQAYGRVSGQLGFALSTKVPVVLFTPTGQLTRENAAAYAASDAVAPPEPHRSRIVLPVPDADSRLDGLVRHELTHVLVYEIVSPGVGGVGGVPLWVHEGIASYMAAEWSVEEDRRMRDLVASGDVPALSQLTGNGGFADRRFNNTLGHVAFDFIESRWGPDSIRRFLDLLAVAPDLATYESVFDQTPARFDESFRQYVEDRFRSGVR